MENSVNTKVAFSPTTSHANAVDGMQPLGDGLIVQPC